ncbi:hypothetical protein FRZ67_22345 [Panacibacter ginsenosidivorans]|uniref:Cytochrome c n=1 Tax=Panacibacter ginsenosidivorans TaxID=1813871 RepID=A0A5B8VFX3_9BACT|nr:hypothetical protein [Panacibacter ginsenosidivorans]QEC69902.1 hypothetical protein FRZ67_22345 [Panacibacter ginsenosidivorans]
MKRITFFSFSLILLACNTQPSNQLLQNRIDSLQTKLANTYKPGFGEFMSGIQIHHAKLWFAGQNQNWQLADFEVHEIQESLDDIKEYCTDRKETNEIGMIDAPIDSLNNAIAQKDLARFKNSYILLTNTCNQCHKATDHGFNVIKMPASPPFSNQEFSGSVKNPSVQVSDTTKAK